MHQSVPQPIIDAAREMLIAFAEGVIWNDEQRAAYETLSSLLATPKHTREAAQEIEHARTLAGEVK